MSWCHHAACQGEDLELFFPIDTAGPALVQLMNAKGCLRPMPGPERVSRWAVVNGIEYGVCGVGWVRTNTEPSSINLPGSTTDA